MATITQLDDHAIATIAAAFSLGEVQAWVPIAAGTINSNFSVHTGRGRVFVRVNEGKSEADVRYEAELVTALARAGVPTPMPLCAGGGEPFVVHQERFVSAFSWVAGVHREAGEVTPGDVRAVGQALAVLHQAGLPMRASFESPGIYTFEHICGRVEQVRAHLARSPDPVLAPALERIAEEIAYLRSCADIRAAATRGVIHGDLFRDNVLFDSARVAALIDFEQASTGSLVYDLAVCLNAWCFIEAFDAALVRAMVVGYQHVRRLAPEEVRALPVELRAAAMRFAVTRITDLYLAGVDTPSKDFRRYLRRLDAWRRLGAAGVLTQAGLTSAVQGQK